MSSPDSLSFSRDLTWSCRFDPATGFFVFCFSTIPMLHRRRRKMKTFSAVAAEWWKREPKLLPLNAKKVFPPPPSPTENGGRRRHSVLRSREGKKKHKQIEMKTNRHRNRHWRPRRSNPRAGGGWWDATAPYILRFMRATTHTHTHTQPVFRIFTLPKHTGYTE